MPGLRSPSFICHRASGAEAEQFLGQVKRDFPKDSVAYRMLGDYYFAEGDLDKATAEYGSLHQQHPKDPEVSRNYVQLLILKNRLPEADQLNEAMLKSNGKDDQALTFRGEIQLQRNQINEAVQTLQGVVARNPDMAVAHYQLGLALSRLGEPDRAGAEWQEAIRLRPEYGRSRSCAGRTFAAKIRHGRSRAICQRDNSATACFSRRLRTTLGFFHGTETLSGRELDARKAVEVAPQSPAGYLEMGI